MDEYTDIKNSEKFVLEVFKFIVWILGCYLVALVINTTVIVNGQVPTSSMESTIMTGDRFIANRFAYAYSKPQRYDIIVFESPVSDKLLVKRIIGLPGEEVKFDEGILYIDNVLTEEPYINEEMYGNFGPYNIPEDSYLVLGDNRNNSIDARSWTNTYIVEEDILGKAVFTYFPKINKLD